jgi:uncharacterized protein YyaL (SSP411 family)
MLAAVLALAVVAAGRADPPRPTNRLANETSPYLLLHAHNPVDWYPWGPEAFAKARKEGKLVFLSIGYSSCYWCHVMERESFANPEVAKLLNQWFVCIKVDREERPEVDTLYLTALNVLGERGGWPMSMFLTADGKPIFGGTYFPPEDRKVEGETVPGFKTILKNVHDLQTKRPKDLADQADKLAQATADALAGRVRGIALVDLKRDRITATLDDIKMEFDPDHGGFGSGARGFRGVKFPMPPYLQLLVYEADRHKSAEVTDILDVTLDHMARGGIYDQLGGGFHRYSTERTWTVPHFEKMLYDNAQLVEVYARAYRLTKKPLYRRVVRETLAFVRREMTAPEGGFYSALDAETNGEEGRFYVWTDRELEEALPDKADLALMRKVYGADAGANFEQKYHVLTLPHPLAETAKDLKMTEDQLEARLVPVRQKLFDVRSKRPRPLLDTKVLTGWNGEMIAGYAVAGQVFEEPAYLDSARRAADFLLQHLRTREGRLLHTYGARPGAPGEAKINGYLDDYAYLVDGLLCLHDATSEKRWLDEAQGLTELMIRLFEDKGGGFFYTANDHEKFFARAKDDHDGVQPAGNSAAARNFVRLWMKTGDEKYRALAEKTLKAFAGPFKANPASLTAMALALDLYLDEQPPPPKAAAAGPAKTDSKVKLAVKADKPDADGKQVLKVTLTMDEGWHVYANPVGLEEFASVQTVIAVNAKVKPQEVKVAYPKGEVVMDALVGDYAIYKDKVEIPVTVVRARGDTGPLEVSVKFQACCHIKGKEKCLPKAEIKQTVP